MIELGLKWEGGVCPPLPFAFWSVLAQLLPHNWLRKCLYHAQLLGTGPTPVWLGVHFTALFSTSKVCGTEGCGHWSLSSHVSTASTHTGRYSPDDLPTDLSVYFHPIGGQHGPSDLTILPALARKYTPVSTISFLLFFHCDHFACPGRRSTASLNVCTETILCWY